MTTVLVAGAVANKPGNGGAAWTRLSWAVGLAQVGFDVHVVEQLADGADPDADADAWFTEVMGDFGLTCRSTLLRADGTTATGLGRAQLVDLASSAAMLLNISGHLKDPAIMAAAATTVFVDLDPGYTQLWHADGTATLDAHDHWYTVGTLIGTAACGIPTGDIEWRPILQPVVLEDWPVQAPVPCDRFTTVASWRGAYGPVTFGDSTLGTKAHEFRRFRDLPRRIDADLELCLEIHPGDDADRAALDRSGWHLVDPATAVASPHAFRRYVQGSPAELSVAQAVYVHPRTGWFSDRSVRYLASGRPVLVQDTGFSQVLPVGEGLLAFDDDDGAVAGARSITADVERHARAARILAEECFDARRVLGRMCEEVGVAP